MNLTEKQILLIQEYLSDTLSDAHQKEFDEHIKESNFRRSLWIQANILEGLAENKNAQLREKISTFKKNDDEVVSLKKNSWMKYAAMIVLVLGAVFLMKSFFSQTDIDSQALFAKYYEPVPSEDIQRGGGVEHGELSRLMISYADGDYKAVSKAFETTSFEDNIIVYKLIALIELNQTSEAKSLAFELKASSDPQVQDMAEWYEMLILVKQGQIKQVESLANEYLSQENHTFNKEIKALLGELKQ